MARPASLLVALVKVRAPSPLKVTVHAFLALDPEVHPSIQTCTLCTLPRRNRHHQTKDPTLFMAAGSSSHVPNQ